MRLRAGTGTLTPSCETRLKGWNEIENAESAPDGVPARLQDTWDLEKRSREYLNASMDKFDLDNTYYAQAYVADDGTNV